MPINLRFCQHVTCAFLSLERSQGKHVKITLWCPSVVVENLCISRRHFLVKSNIVSSQRMATLESFFSEIRWSRSPAQGFTCSSSSLLAFCFSFPSFWLWVLTQTCFNELSHSFVSLTAIILPRLISLLIQFRCCCWPAGAQGLDVGVQTEHVLAALLC